jgi:hypothetical protein
MDSIVFSFTDNMLLRENDIYGNRIDGWCLFLLGVHLILRVQVFCSFRLKNRRFKSEINLSEIEDHDDTRKIERELSQQIEDAMLEEAAGTTGKPSLV